MYIHSTQMGSCSGKLSTSLQTTSRVIDVLQSIDLAVADGKITTDEIIVIINKLQKIKTGLEKNEQP